MFSGLPAGAWELPEPLRPFLHDSTLFDIGISLVFLLTIGALLYRSFRPGQSAGEQSRWVWLTVALIVLLGNQQGDLQTPLLKMFYGAARTYDIDLNSTAPLLVVGLLYGTACAVLALSLLGSASWNRAPGMWGHIGMGMIFIHAAGRGATFLGLIKGRSHYDGLHLTLVLIEVIGLLLLAVAAIRYRPPSEEAPRKQTAHLAGQFA